MSTRAAPAAEAGAPTDDLETLAACAQVLPELLRTPDQPRLVFQPIIDLGRAVVAGYEALARFDASITATPDVWFAAAAQAGVGPELERRVVRRALQARHALPVNCFLTINVSPRALTSAEVMAEFQNSGDLSGIFVELTEQQHILDIPTTRDILQQLRDHGAMIAMDDAGSGYSGLQRLLALRPELMKIDRSLVSGIDADEAKKACVEMLGVLANRLDAWLLAEGVETAEELRTLIGLDVPLAQGFLLGRPVEGWSDLDARTTARIRVASRELLGSRQLVRLVERVRLRPAGTEPPPDPDSIAVDLDDDGRPTALVFTDGAASVRRVPVTLRLPVTTPIAEAAKLVLDRPVDRRLDPLLCVHDDGTVAGAVRVERVFRYLAER
ncbi:MAG: EAL domain-containing protein [Acidothermus sp.]|nr:EAL domain-containing protein [Acidothermus sp.]MCL6538840.1 EAL domain-containing protein [Acidothermus sp.]